MLTAHVENVSSLIRIDFRSCLISCVFSVIDQTRHQNVVKQYAGLCDTLTSPAHHATSLFFLKSSEGKHRRFLESTDGNWMCTFLLSCPAILLMFFRQIVIRVETLSSTNLFALRYREKASPSPAGADVRRKHA